MQKTKLLNRFRHNEFYCAWQHHRLLTESAIFYSTVWNSHFSMLKFGKYLARPNLIWSKISAYFIKYLLLELIGWLSWNWLTALKISRAGILALDLYFQLLSDNFTNLCLHMLLKVTPIVCLSLNISNCSLPLTFHEEIRD